MIHFARLFKLAKALAVVAIAACAGAQQSSSSASSSSVEIVLTTAIYKTSDMKFGSIVAGARGGTVVLSTSGSRTVTGSIYLPEGSSVSAAGFAVLGTPSTSFSISYPSSIALNQTGGLGSMTVSPLVASPSYGGTLSTGGSATVYIGGTLNVSANQAPGAYTGSFAVTVSYP